MACHWIVPYPRKIPHNLHNIHCQIRKQAVKVPVKVLASRANLHRVPRQSVKDVTVVKVFRGIEGKSSKRTVPRALFILYPPQNRHNLHNPHMWRRHRAVKVCQILRNLHKNLHAILKLNVKVVTEVKGFTGIRKRSSA